MRYLRSRPWRARGPWLGALASTRRRGHYDRALCSPAAETDDNAAFVATDGEDVLLDQAPALKMTELSPLSGGIGVAHIDQAGLLAASAQGAGASAAAPSADRLLEAALAARALAPRHDEADARQSA